MPQTDAFHGVRSNFVINELGEFKDSEGSSRGISNGPDFQMLLKLRAQSDLIITDAATAARERYRPSKFAAIEVWSSSGNFRGIRAQEGLALVSAREATNLLKERKTVVTSILLEAGPTLTREFAKAKLIDELRLSVIGSLSLSKAEGVARRFADSIALSYLDKISCVNAAETWFFTFSR